MSIAAPLELAYKASMLGILAIILALTAAKDSELFERVARGDRAAFRTVYDRASGRAYAIALRILASRGDADDVVQEVFVDVWRRAAEYDVSRGGSAAWIATMTRTRAIDRLRARNSQQRIAVAAGQEESPPANSPLETTEQREERERINQALCTLPAEQRAAIELAYFQGLSQREIAERTGDPLGTVKTRMRLGLEKLAAVLDLRSAKVSL